MHIGERIKERRKELNISVDELAKRLDKNRATVYRYEKGDIENLPINVLEPLAKALETTPQYILGWGEQIRNLSNDLKKGEDLTIGEVIRALRLDYNMTQEQCSSEIGIPLKDLEMYEAGSKQVSGSIINIIAKFFDVEPVDIVDKLLYPKEEKEIKLKPKQEYVKKVRLWYQEFGEINFTQEEIKQLFDYGRFLAWKRNNKQK